MVDDTCTLVAAGEMTFSTSENIRALLGKQ